MDDDTLYLAFCGRRQQALQLALQSLPPGFTPEDLIATAERYVQFMEDYVPGETPEPQTEHVTH